MTKAPNIFHVIKDPVHGTMQFTSAEDKWVKPFIDSPHFQRLRHIKQLGMGDYIFPGAVHTRFNHCLGCCYIASQIAQKIGLADEERQLVMIAGLLHDIGHGPFSHAFEGLFHQKAIRHEDWTPYFLADYATEKFFHHYNIINPRYHLSTEKFKQIAAMIMHQQEHKSVLADIVSSQLDADRLDYLLRDSHFCGVRYGEFDFRWMLHCMAIVNSKDGERLGITYKGIGVVEHYLMARRLMLRNIYHSQKKMALETLLVQLLAQLAQHLEQEAKLFGNIVDSRLGKFLIAANKFNQAALKQQHVEKLKADFLTENYVYYKALCDYDVFNIISQLAQLDNPHPAVQIARRLHLREMPKVINIDNQVVDVVRVELTTFKMKFKNTFQDWQLQIVQTPQHSYSGEDDPVLVINEQQQVQPLGKFSPAINAIADRLEHITFLSIDQQIVDDARIIELIQKLESVNLRSFA